MVPSPGVCPPFRLGFRRSYAPALRVITTYQPSVPDAPDASAAPRAGRPLIGAVPKTFLKTFLAPFRAGGCHSVCA